MVFGGRRSYNNPASRTCGNSRAIFANNLLSNTGGMLEKITILNGRSNLEFYPVEAAAFWATERAAVKTLEGMPGINFFSGLHCGHSGITLPRFSLPAFLYSRI